ncbi:copper resistance protein CopB [Lysobacter arseniciresistens ZS79]|uniref:Copper resistance protein CopB n=1 Tax=Lysobacter arseniciresistens ZS79 TaxID=913325 RepID=A0A0A0F5G9_9GAMM|nr:copper resistance protein B [Lysobacter arseniciresistens]KGM57623.1 copper resistance protein CopB [Lysobacter arseniciresistens ZS79]
MNRHALPRLALAVALVACFGGPAALAQDDPHDLHQGHGQHAPALPTATDEADVDHSQHRPAAADDSGTDHAAMGHSMDHAGMDHSTMDHSGMDATAAPTQPRVPIPPLTDADRAAAFPELHHTMHHGDGVHGFLLVDRLEAWDGDHGTGQGWELQGWLGGDINRAWLRSEGEREGGETHAADIELLYGRAVSAWWDVVAGVRHDFAPGDSRSWAAVGVQGLAPYMFETQATAYFGESGRVEAVIEVEYELLLTNRLILQPAVEATFTGRDDADRGVASGLSSSEAGLRLRYEFTRRFAPYVGLVHERSHGGTADLRRDAGEPVHDTRWVVGLRTWF